MADPDKTVFLSYRREVSWPLAQAVRADLAAHGFDVFVDVHGIDSGEFERVILREIESRMHFLVLLEPRSLDRVADEGDWLRREIAHALAHERNVVPLLANDARMPRARDLPADIARLPAFNAVSVPHEYFPEAMRKLRERFLRIPAPSRASPVGLTDTAEPASPPSALSPEPLVVAPRLSAVRWLDNVELTWTTVPGAAAYVLQSDAGRRRGDFAEVYQGFTLSCRYLPGDGAPAWFRVRGERGWNVGPWSNTVQAWS